MTVYSLLRNPVSYSVYAFSILLVVISFGEAPGLVAQHLIIPYTIDVSRGVGDLAATGYRIVAFISQFLVCLSIYVVTRLEAGRRRAIIAVFGVILAGFHFLTIAVGYVAPRLH